MLLGREGGQSGHHTAVDRLRRVDAIYRFPGRHAGQQGDTIVSGGHGVDVEPSGARRGHDVLTQHKVLDVGCGDEDALLPGQAARLAHVEKALDLLVYPADGLNLAALVDRSGDGQRLADRHAGQGRHQSIQFGRRGAIPVYAAVRLLEDERGAEGQWLFGSVARSQEAGQNQHTLGMDWPPHVHLTLDVDDVPLAHAHASGDA